MKQRMSNQRGMVLVMSLVLMLILTVLATASMEVSTLQERIAGNTRDTTAAFQAAEASVRYAERYLEGASIGQFTGGNGRYEICASDDTRAACQAPAWKDRTSTGWVAAGETLSNVSRQPEYIIEKYTAVQDPEAPLDADQPLATQEFYRVTARGYGVSDRSIVVLQTTYRRN